MFVDCLGTVRWFRVIVIIMFSANVIPVLQVGTYKNKPGCSILFHCPGRLEVTLQYPRKCYLSITPDIYFIEPKDACVSVESEMYQSSREK